MIRYGLKCANGHQFESWFQSASAFDILKDAGHVTCIECGTADVEKMLMAPALGARQANAPSPREEALAKLRQHVAQNSEYVGNSFATEARRMHDGDAPTRSIHGEARIEDARKLLEDGVPVAPLPFLPPRRVN